MARGSSNNSVVDISGPSTSKSSLKGHRRRGSRVVPKDAILIPNIPHEHYFSDVKGVYYHFKKMEWRTICKDPFKNSKRWQKTFGINKYGFYEAKQRAEIKAHEVTEKNQLSKILCRYSSFRDDPNLQTRYFNPITDLSPRFNPLNNNSRINFNSKDKPLNGHTSEVPGGFPNLKKINYRGQFFHDAGPDSYKLNDLCYRTDLVPVQNLKENSNVFVNLPSFSYRFVSIATPNQLTNADFN